MDADVLVQDYLDRLAAAAAVLPVNRRGELTAEVREHINAALAEAGRADEVTVRNIIERLGSPEEIVASEAGQAGMAGGAAVAAAAGVPVTGSRWGAVEVSAVVLIGLAWPALLLPPVLSLWFGPFLWIAFGVIGLVLVWASGVWTTRRKVTATTCVLSPYLLVILLTMAAGVTCTTGDGTPQPCPPGDSSPVVTGS